jgi:hypothetical protein
LGIHPVKTMDALKAVRWAVKSWEEDTTTKTVWNCFLKSGIKAFEPTTLPAAEIQHAAEKHQKEQENAMQKLMEECVQAGFIKERMSLKEFLNPVEETVEDSCDALEDQIVKEYTQVVEEEDDEVVEERKAVTVEQALEATQILSQWEEQQVDGELWKFKHLQRQERDLKTKLLQKKLAQKQTTLDKFFK